LLRRLELRVFSAVPPRSYCSDAAITRLFWVEKLQICKQNVFFSKKLCDWFFYIKCNFKDTGTARPSHLEVTAAMLRSPNYFGLKNYKFACKMYFFFKIVVCLIFFL